jgi:hypothetical protein
MQAEKLLTTKNKKTDFGVTNSDFETKALTNWSATSLQFYLGAENQVL